MKYRGIFEYEYPTEHKPPVSIDVHLHGECVKGKIIEWEYRPLEQKPKTGHWIEKDGFDGDTYYDCSECGESWTTIEGTPWQNGMNYCPNCGAKMVEPQERSGEE